MTSESFGYSFTIIYSSSHEGVYSGLLNVFWGELVFLSYKIREEKMTQLTIVANIKTKADKVELVKAELLKLIAVTRAEEGCINYDLHQDNENPAHFMFYENWQSRELWQTHMGNIHLKEYMAATEGAVEAFTLSEMCKIA